MTDTAQNWESKAYFRNLGEVSNHFYRLTKQIEYRLFQNVEWINNYFNKDV